MEDMNEIRIEKRLTAIETTQGHIVERLDHAVGLLEDHTERVTRVEESVKTYKKLSWATLSAMVVACAKSLLPG